MRLQVYASVASSALSRSPVKSPVGSDLGAVWRIGPQTFVSRRILSDLFLDFLEKLNAATSQTSK